MTMTMMLIVTTMMTIMILWHNGTDAASIVKITMKMIRLSVNLPFAKRYGYLLTIATAGLVVTIAT